MKRRDMIILLVAVFALIFTFYGNRVNLLNGEERVKNSSGIVKEVIDGDTAKVEVNGELKTVRFLGIDTPELSEEDNPREYKNITNKSCLKEWAYKANNYTENKLEGKKVNLIYDSKAGREGYYGRTLAYIQVNGTDFTKELVEEGFARVYYESNFQREIDYMESEKEAYEEKRGLWTCG